MQCPNCSIITHFSLSHCHDVGTNFSMEHEQPLPNWRKLPGFRTRTQWKMVIAGISTLVLIVIIIPLFLIF